MKAEARSQEPEARMTAASDGSSLVGMRRVFAPAPAFLLASGFWLLTPSLIHHSSFIVHHCLS
jgi:hypothetical protein